MTNQTSSPGGGRRDARSPEIERITHALRRLIRALNIHSRKMAGEAGVTAAQLYALRAVATGRGRNATTIARCIHLSPSTVVGILDRLEENGLVERIRDENDRRVVNVTATEEGAEFVQSVADPIQNALARAMDDIGKDELAKIASQLEGLVGVLGAGALSSRELREEQYEETDEGFGTGMSRT